MRLIETNPELANLADRLASARLVGADTEAAGYHRYHDRICLLQLSTREGTTLVDTLAVDSLAALGPVFGDPEIETIFHDADFDLRLLHRDHGIRARGLFDTKVAAQFVGERAIGLASLLEAYLGVTLAKKYQRADWAKRPLPAAMLEYAAEDTRYLPELRDRLRERLVETGRLAWAEEEFRLLEEVQWEDRDADDFLRLKNSRDLDPRELAVLREVHAVRERVAEARDVAAFRVLSSEALVELARSMPASEQALRKTQGVGAATVARLGEQLLAAIVRGRELPEAELPERPPRPPRPPYDPMLDELTDRLKAARDAVARKLGLDRGFLMSRDQLRSVARARPGATAELAALPGVRRWQIDALGESLVRALRDAASAPSGPAESVDPGERRKHGPRDARAG
ncbi:MAG: ribonuclease D [Longimicrobiales bacterium]